MFHRQMKKIHPIFDFFYKEKYLAQNLGHFAPSKKGLIKIGSEIASQKGFTEYQCLLSQYGIYTAYD